MTRVIWIYGMPASGKTSIARELRDQLSLQGYSSAWLDGDHVRELINGDLGHLNVDRTENIRRIAGMAELLRESVSPPLDFVIVSCMTPRRAHREMVYRLLWDCMEPEALVFVQLECPLVILQERDATRGKIYQLGRSIPGYSVGDPFEFESPHGIVLNTYTTPLRNCVNELYEHILPAVEYEEDPAMY